MYSFNDSMQTPEEIVKRVKETGGRSVTLTDHGTMLGIEPFMDAGKKYDINTIPGVEAYTENRHHLVIVAKNYEGYTAISHAMREANKHIEAGKKISFPIMTKEILERFFKGNNDVIASTACIQGIVPFTLLENYRIKKEIQKKKETIKELRDDYMSYLEYQAQYEECEEQIKKIKESVQDTHKYTLKGYLSKKTKAVARIKKLRETGNDDEKTLSLIAEQERIIKEIEDNYELGVKRDKEAEEKIAIYTEKKKTAKERMKNKEKKYKKFNQAEESLFELSLTDENALFDKAYKELMYLKSIFPNLYVELQYHGMEEEAYVMPILVKLAKKTNTPIIAANDAHITYNTEECVEARRIIRFNYFEKAVTTSDIDRSLYMKTDDELTEALSVVVDKAVAIEAVKNTSILDECNVVFPEEKHYPTVDTELSFDEMLESKRQEMIKAGEWDEEHELRFIKEKQTIKSMGYVDYHMIVQDYCNMLRILGMLPKNKVEALINEYGFNGIKDYITKNKSSLCGTGVGPGRGSAAGSLVCYMLGITNIDPIKYNLLFERFLNPERVTMPDIDTDVRTSLRPLIIKYLMQKYGKNAVCSIATELSFGAKSAIKMVGRDRASQLYEHITNKEEKKKKKREYAKQYTNVLADEVPDEVGTTLSSCEKELESVINKNKEMTLLWKRAKLLEGRIYSSSIHAGGVIISDNDDINDYIPLAWNEEKGVWSCQCNMIRAEEKGLLKMDLLGLNTLDYISDCLNLIVKHHGIAIDINNIPLDDENVYREIYSKGITNSVFQFESDGMKSMLKDFKPTTFEDLILLVAAYRPGPMQYLPDIISVKNNKSKPSYKTPMLKDILSDTYGAVIYQEQVMTIFQELAGYSLGSADLVRRAMSKKKVKQLEIERKAFIYGDENRGIKGCIANGINKDIANQLFDELMEFAKYAFNKSHAAVYALVSYQTAYLKYYYPAEYLCALLNNKNQNEFEPIVEDCNYYGIDILPVDINYSYFDFVCEDGSIRYGFKGLNELGEANRELYERIAENRNNGIYVSVNDFLCRNLIATEDDKYKIFPLKQYTILVEVGAFDKFGYERSKLLTIPKIDKNTYDVMLLKINGISFEQGFEDIKYNINKEIEHAGMILSYNPLKMYLEDKKYGCTPINEIMGYEKSINILGLITSVTKTKSKKGNDMVIVKITGKTGNMTGYIVGKNLSRINTDAILNEVHKIEGSISGNNIFINDINMIPPYTTCYQLIIEDENTFNIFNEIYDGSSIGNEVHVLTYYIKRGDIIARLTTPLVQTCYLSQEACNLLLQKGINICQYN